MIPKNDDTRGQVRCFLAFPIDDAVQRQLSKALKTCLAHYGGYRGIRQANWHMTVFFLGRQPLSRLQELFDPISDLLSRQHPGDSIRLTRLGGFPGRERPRFIAAEGKLPDSFVEWHRRLGELLTQRGVEPDRVHWRPHVSLARRQGHGHSGEVGDLPLEDCVLTVNRLQLLMSTPTPDGSAYSPLRAWSWS